MEKIRKAKSVYQFDLTGKQIKQFPSIKQAHFATRIPEHNIKAAIARKSCVGQSWYFSKEAVFTFPEKRANFNPLASTGGNDRVGFRFINGFEDEE